MAKTLAEDLRSRVVAAIDGGLSRRGAAERFGIISAALDPDSWGIPKLLWM